MTDLRGLTRAQAIIIRLKIRGVYEERVNSLKEIRERHVYALVNSDLGMDSVTLRRRLIRDIDESIKNHGSMLEAVLSEIQVPE